MGTRPCHRIVSDEYHVPGHLRPPFSGCGAAPSAGERLPVCLNMPRAGFRTSGGVRSAAARRADADPPAVPQQDAAGGGQGLTTSAVSTLTPCCRPGQALASRAASSGLLASITTYPVRIALAGSPPSLAARVRTVPTWLPGSAIAVPTLANPAPPCRPSTGWRARSRPPATAPTTLLITC